MGAHCHVRCYTYVSPPLKRGSIFFAQGADPFNSTHTPSHPSKGATKQYTVTCLRTTRMRFPATSQAIARPYQPTHPPTQANATNLPSRHFEVLRQNSTKTHDTTLLHQLAVVVSKCDTPPAVVALMLGFLFWLAKRKHPLHTTPGLCVWCTTQQQGAGTPHCT